MPESDRGYFPRGRSVLRRVHGARIVGRAFEGLALAMRAGAWAAPAWIRRGSCGRDYRMVAEAERRRLAGVGA